MQLEIGLASALNNYIYIYTFFSFYQQRKRSVYEAMHSSEIASVYTLLKTHQQADVLNFDSLRPFPALSGSSIVPAIFLETQLNSPAWTRWAIFRSDRHYQHFISRGNSGRTRIRLPLLGRIVTGSPC